MTFIFKLLVYGIQISVGIVAIAATILLVVFVISRVVQFVAPLLGYEVGSLFDWMFGGLVKKLKRSRRRKK